MMVSCVHSNRAVALSAGDEQHTVATVVIAERLRDRPDGGAPVGLRAPPGLFNLSWPFFNYIGIPPPEPRERNAKESALNCCALFFFRVRNFGSAGAARMFLTAEARTSAAAAVVPAPMGHLGQSRVGGGEDSHGQI